MPDFSNPSDSVANMAAGNPGINMGTTGGMRDTEYASDDLWGQHDAHFREHHASRPYAAADRPYEHYQPAYRYGHEAGRRHAGRPFHEVEGELEQGWHSAHGASGSAWQDMKHAVRDAFERVGHR